MKYILINNSTNIIQTIWTVPDNFDVTQVNEPNLTIHKCVFEVLPDMVNSGLLTITIVEDAATAITYVPRPKTIRNWSFENKVWIDKTTTAFKFDELRNKRNLELLNSDWTQSPDSPLSSGLKTSWATWRQSLRNVVDVTKTPEECFANFDVLIQNKPI